MDEKRAEPAGMDDDLSTLCQACGLCCDGSLFGRVDLAPDEVGPARRHHLRVIAGGKAFEQPCVALGAGDHRACAIYEARPAACKAFTCRLYDRQCREGGPIDARLAAVQRVRSLVAELVAMGLTPADFEGEPATLRAPHGERARAERAFRDLTRRLEDDFARASVGAGTDFARR